MCSSNCIKNLGDRGLNIHPMFCSAYLDVKKLGKQHWFFRNYFKAFIFFHWLNFACCDVTKMFCKFIRITFWLKILNFTKLPCHDFFSIFWLFLDEWMVWFQDEKNLSHGDFFPAKICTFVGHRGLTGRASASYPQGAQGLGIKSRGGSNYIIVICICCWNIQVFNSIQKIFEPRRPE